MSDFQSKIISVKDLLIEVNDLLAKQKNALDSTAESIAKYGKNSKLPSDFSNAQKESIENAKKQTEIQKQIEQSAKNQTAAMQKLTKEELNYTKAVERGIKAKEREVLANKKLSDAYGQLTAKRNETGRALQNSIIQTGKYSSETQKLQKEFDTLNKKVGQADKAIGKFSQSNNSIQNLTSGVSNLMGAFGISTGLYLGANIVKDIYETTKQLQSLDLALKMVSGTQEEFASNQSFLTNLAEQYGIEIKGLTKNFTEFWVASKDKLKADQIKEIFTSISKSVAVMGLSVEQQDSAFLALQQMMSKGTVQAEELKKQLGNALPGAIKAATMAYQALHPEMKVTEELFMKEMKAGKVLSSELLPELARQYEKLYGIENVKRAETLQAAQERLANSWTEMVRAMTSGDGKFTRFLTSSMSLINDIVKGLTYIVNSSSSNRKSVLQFVETNAYEENKKAIEKFSKEEVESLKKYDKEKAAILTEEFNRLKNRNIVLKALRRDTPFGEIETRENKAERIANQKRMDDINEQLTHKKGLIKSYNEFLDAENKKVSEREEEETEKERKAREKAEKERQKKIEESHKIDYDLAISNAETKRDLIKREYEDFKGSIDGKIQLSQKLALAEKNIVDIKEKESKRVAKGDGRLLNIAENVSFSETGKLLEDNNKRIQNIFKDHFNELEKMPDTIFGDKYKLTKEQEDELKRIEKLTEKAREDVLNYINSFTGEAADKLGFKETFDFFLKMDEDGRTMWQKLDEYADGSKEKQVATFQAIAESAQEVFNFVSDLSQKKFENEYNRLEKEKDAALGFAGDSDAAKKKIEEDYEKRRKEIAKREFKAKQQQTIVNIAMDTAQAIIGLWVKPGFPAAIPMAIAMAGLGAIQAGIVASQKVPEFWKGTNNAPAGLAWTNERGAEIHTDKKGNIKDFGDNKGARLTMMEAGDKVYTAEQTKRLLFNDELNNILTSNNIMPSNINVNSQGMTASEMDAVLSKHFANIQINHTSWDNNGIITWSEKNGNRTIQDTNRGSRKGLRV